MSKIHDDDEEEIKKPKKRVHAPATSPEDEEAQLIGLAVNLARKQLLDGSASAQVITHYLKLGSTKEQTEKHKLEKEIELLEAKADSLKSAKKQEELYEDAVKAFTSYTPTQED